MKNSTTESIIGKVWSNKTELKCWSSSTQWFFDSYSQWHHHENVTAAIHTTIMMSIHWLQLYTVSQEKSAIFIYNFCISSSIFIICVPLETWIDYFTEELRNLWLCPNCVYIVCGKTNTNTADCFCSAVCWTGCS